MLLRIMLLSGLCGVVMTLAYGDGGPMVPSQEFQRGVTLTTWATDHFASPASCRTSLGEVQELGVRWVAISFTCTQLTHDATAIQRTMPYTPRDRDLEHFIRDARRQGLRVLLRPALYVSDEPGRWHGEIGDGFATDAAWAAWFASYERNILHYARLAKRAGAAIFCVGAELQGTTHRTAEWRRVIARVRAVYPGRLVYAGNWTESAQITWWDAVDYIGVNAYYPLSEAAEPTVEELQKSWLTRGYIEEMATLAQQYQRPILITEIGYRSVAGTAAEPWDFLRDTPVDPLAQAVAYRAALSVFYRQPWLAGIYWWAWDINPSIGGLSDTGYSPRGKPAAEVMAQYYAQW